MGELQLCKKLVNNNHYSEAALNDLYTDGMKRGYELARVGKRSLDKFEKNCNNFDTDPRYLPMFRYGKRGSYKLRGIGKRDNNGGRDEEIPEMTHDDDDEGIHEPDPHTVVPTNQGDWGLYDTNLWKNAKKWINSNNNKREQKRWRDVENLYQKKLPYNFGIGRKRMKTFRNINW